MLKLSFCRKTISRFLVRRFKSLDHSAGDEGKRRIEQRLSGDDPYWWILAGGIHLGWFPGPDAVIGADQDAGLLSPVSQPDALPASRLETGTGRPDCEEL